MAGSKDDPTANEYATEANEKRQVVKTRKRKTMGIVAVVTILLALGLTLGLYFGLRKSDDGGNNNNNNDDGEDKGHLLLRKNDSKADPKYQNPGTGNPGTGPALQGTPGDNSTKWLPQAGTTWQIAIHDAIKIDLKKPSIQPANVNVFDIDLYTNDAKTIAALHSLGKRVICYFSAGSYEPYRPDSKLFNKKSIGATMDGWEDENWVDIRSDNIRKIMAARIKLASEKKCDGIDPDNMDGYNNVNGLGLKPKDTIEYVKFLADEAKKYNLALGLKNAGEVVESVLGMVDFAVNEQCEEYAECETFAPFIKSDKAVFHVEYPDSAPKVSAKTVNEICSQKGKAKGTQKFSTVIKSMNLSGWTQYCNGVTATTSLQ